MAALEWRGRPRFTDQPHLTMDCLPALKGLVRHPVTRRAEHFLFLPPAAVSRSSSTRAAVKTALPVLPARRLVGSQETVAAGNERTETERDMSQPSFHNGRLMQAPEVDHHQPSAATAATDRVKPFHSYSHRPRIAVSILRNAHFTMKIDIHLIRHLYSCSVMLISSLCPAALTFDLFKVADPRGLPRQLPTS